MVSCRFSLKPRVPCSNHNGHSKMALDPSSWRWLYRKPSMVTLRGNQTWLGDLLHCYNQWPFQVPTVDVPKLETTKKDLRKGYMCRPLNPTVPPVEVPNMAIDIKGGDLKLSYKCRIFHCNVWFAEVYSNSPAFHSGSLFHSRRSHCSRHVQFLEAGASEKLRAHTHTLRSFNVAIENGPFFWSYWVSMVIYQRVVVAYWSNGQWRWDYEMMRNNWQTSLGKGFKHGMS